MKKVLTCVMAAAVLALFLVGCRESSESDLSNSTVTGQVTAVDGNSVTLLLGELTENEMGTPPSGDTASGTAPSGAPSGEAPSGEAPAGEAPSGDGSGEVPSGEAPSGGDSGEAPSGGGSMSSFTAGEESVTITITDDTVITIEGMGDDTEGTIADITADSILEVSFGADNTVTSVTVKNIMGGGKNA